MYIGVLRQPIVYLYDSVSRSKIMVHTISTLPLRQVFGASSCVPITSTQFHFTVLHEQAKGKRQLNDNVFSASAPVRGEHFEEFTFFLVISHLMTQRSRRSEFEDFPQPGSGLV